LKKKELKELTVSVEKLTDILLPPTTTLNNLYSKTAIPGFNNTNPSNSGIHSTI
jgi:hypothetical protein